MSVCGISQKSFFFFLGGGGGGGEEEEHIIKQTNLIHVHVE